MSRIILENRTKLEEVIPLDTPFVVNVDPSSLCNLSCEFCFQHSDEKPKYNIMSMDLYKSIINQLKEFPKKIKTLRLYALGEPLINKEFSNMVRYAKEHSIAEFIDTTTNGILLTPKRSIDIIESGLNRINISIYGLNSYQYNSFCNRRVDFYKLLDNIKFLYNHKEDCYIYIKINGDSLLEYEKTQFKQIFTPYCDELCIEHTMNCWNGIEVKENSNIGIYGQEIKQVDVCPYIFYSYTVHSNGQVSACFLDWNKKLIVGDATKQSLVSIWNGNKINDLRRLMLNKEREHHSVCSSCGQLSHGMCDNIDPYSKDILKRMF